MKIELFEDLLQRIGSGKWKWYHLLFFISLSAIVIFCTSYLSEKGKQVAKAKDNLEASNEKNNDTADTKNQGKVNTLQKQEETKSSILPEKTSSNYTNILGIVVDNSNSPISGVKITDQKSNTITYTDENGIFNLKIGVSENSLKTRVFYEKQGYKSGNRFLSIKGQMQKIKIHEIQ